MTKNAADVEKLSVSSLPVESVSDPLPSVMSLAEDGGAAPAPKVVPVPTEDVVKCAKSKCATCFGKGKQTYRAPGEKKARVKVCVCAIRQFVRQHRRELFIDKSGGFYYLPRAEGQVEEEGSSKPVAPSPEAAGEVSDYHRERIRNMFERIVGHQGELAELDERYARMAEPIESELAVAKADRAGEVAKLQEIVDSHAQLQAEVALVERKIEDLAARLLDAKRDKLSIEARMSESAKKIATVQDAALPGVRKQAGIEQRLAYVARKREQAKRPVQQKIESLHKRIGHLVAVNSIPEAVLAELAVPDPGDVLVDAAAEAADEIAAEAVRASE